MEEATLYVLYLMTEGLVIARVPQAMQLRPALRQMEQLDYGVGDYVVYRLICKRPELG
jgi:hypothetical protein